MQLYANEFNTQELELFPDLNECFSLARNIVQTIDVKYTPEYDGVGRGY